MIFLFAVSRRKLRNKAGLSADNSAFFVLEIRAEKKMQKNVDMVKIMYYIEYLVSIARLPHGTQSVGTR